MAELAEGARLEIVYTLTRIEGSNPSLSATFFLSFLSVCAKGDSLRDPVIYIALVEPNSLL